MRLGRVRSALLACAVLVAFSTAGEPQGTQLSSDVPSAGGVNTPTPRNANSQSRTPRRERRGQACEVLGPCGKCDCRAPTRPAAGETGMEPSVNEQRVLD